MEPLRIPYAAGEAASFPPPTQGMSALALLGIGAGFGLASLPEADYVHLLVEAVKVAFEDRDRYLTDPGVMRVHPEELLAPGRLAAMRDRISMRRATPTAAAAPAG